MKKGREEKTKFSKDFPNNRMPHRTSSTRNDYERKINYDWTKESLPKPTSNLKIIKFDAVFVYLFCICYLLISFELVIKSDSCF